MNYRRSQNTRSRSPFSQLLRTTGVIIILVSAGILFWKYYEFSMDRIMGTENNRIQDQTNTLSRNQLDSIQKFSRALESSYGQKFQLQIKSDPFKQPPDTDSRTLFLGLCPEKKQVILQLPVLMKHSLPAEFTEYIEQKHFPRYWNATAWDQGIMDCLNLVWNQLNNLQEEKNK